MIKNKTFYPIQKNLKLTSRKTPIFFLTTSDSDETLKKIRAMQGCFSVFVAYEDTWKLDFPKDVQTWEFTMRNFPFATLKDTLVPGSTIYAFSLFLIVHSFEKAWFVEDDVAVKGGDWSILKKLDNNPADLVAFNFHTSAQRSKLIKEAFFWNKEKKEIELIEALFCISRLSRNAAFHIVQELMNGTYGHHEIIIPTLLKEDGFNLVDLKECGLAKHDSYRFRPFISTEEIEFIQTGLLVHPCKDPKVFSQTSC